MTPTTAYIAYHQQVLVCEQRSDNVESLMTSTTAYIAYHQQVLVLRAEIRQCRVTYDAYYCLHSIQSAGSCAASRDQTMSRHL